MHVISFAVVNATACPGGSVTVQIGVQPDAFDSGNYDLRITQSNYDQAYWTPAKTVTGWANPLGGAFTVSAEVSVPTWASDKCYFGAADNGEGKYTPTYRDWVSVPKAPAGSITISPATGPAPLTAQFGIYSTGGYISSVAWNFGDGGSGSGTSTSHTYTRTGTFNVSATLTNDCGATETLSRSIVVSQPVCSNPYGTEGSYNCQGTTRVKCQSGTWVPVEQNSTQCGYVPPAQNCSNPYGTPGAYNCQGTTRVQCNNGAWTPIEYNSTQCGYVPPNPPPQQGCTNPSGVSGQDRCDGTNLYRCNGTAWVLVDQNSVDCGYTPPPGYDACSNPYGEHGTGRCSGTTRMQCNDGAWIAQEYNSQQCGYVPPTTGCTNPTGANGDTYCDGTTLKQCNGTSWVAKEYNSTQCGYGPNPGGCVNPAGVAGDTYCDGTTMRRCNGTTWLAKEYNSTQCGYVPPTPEPTSDNTLIYVGAGLIAAIGIGYALSRRK